ncbi:MFS transporter [Leucobacter sp. NPDC058333]|uniref:MFS transporter n=1 Tax=Leucobacter sp. NPDC058333 TaxID=3346450 RepID=UPI00364B4CC2
MTQSPHREPVPSRAWVVLTLGLLAQAAGTMLVSAPIYLIPMLHLDRGVPLAAAGTLASAPTLGMVLTLVLWGAAADRFGERWVIAGGLALTAVAAAGAAWAAAATADLVPLGIALFFGGAAAASTNAASGRVVVGWFPRHRRGLAMGVRQMSQPLGVAAAAVAVPPLAAEIHTDGVFVVIGAILAAITLACAFGIRNPPRPVAPPAVLAPTSTTKTTARTTTNPYRADSFLARIHAVSILLVLPQFALATFGMLWLITGLGWNATAAGLLMGIAQFVGALGRIVIGGVSDRVGERVRVLRWVAIAGVAVMLLLALVGAAHEIIPAGLVVGGIVLVIATVVSVADNGLAYTSVAEAAGSAWAGRALGVQNTGQFIAASAVGPGLGAAISLLGYPLVFGLVALAPLIALPLIPKRDQHG